MKYIKCEKCTNYVPNVMTDTCCDCDSICNYEEKRLTHADSIRDMSDEELAALLLDGCRGSKCSEQSQNEYGSVDCFSCRLNWLKQTVKDGEDE